MDTDKMRFIFWDHYDAGMGGIEKLIITLAMDLEESHDIVIVSEKHGVIYDKLSGAGVEFLHVTPDTPNFERYFCGNDLLIDFGGFREMQRLARINPRVLIWRVFPNIGCRGRFGALLFKRMFMGLEKKNALVFMDGTCHSQACRKLGHAFARRILPVPIIEKQNGYVVKRVGRPIQLTYIGRGSRIWKVKPVKKLVADLRKMTAEHFHLHIFTDTNELFEEELRGLKGGNVAVEYHFGYAMEALSKKLLEFSDIHYSMGTACLEGAVLGIPTLIADPCYIDFPDDYKYRWLVEDLENYAGVFLENEVRPGRNLQEIMAEAKDAEKLAQLSMQTHAAVQKHFSSRMIAKKIEAMKPEARIIDVVRFMPSYWLAGGPFQRASAEHGKGRV